MFLFIYMMFTTTNESVVRLQCIFQGNVFSFCAIAQYYRKTKGKAIPPPQLEGKRRIRNHYLYGL